MSGHFKNMSGQTHVTGPLHFVRLSQRSYNCPCPPTSSPFSPFTLLPIPSYHPHPHSLPLPSSPSSFPTLIPIPSYHSPPHPILLPSSPSHPTTLLRIPSYHPPPHRLPLPSPPSHPPTPLTCRHVEAAPRDLQNCPPHQTLGLPETS